MPSDRTASKLNEAIFLDSVAAAEGADNLVETRRLRAQHSVRASALQGRWSMNLLRAFAALIKRARGSDKRASGRRSRPALAVERDFATSPFSDICKLMLASGSYEDAFGMVRRRATTTFSDCSGALYLAPERGGKLQMVAMWGKDAGCGDCFRPEDCRVLRTREFQLASPDMACAQRSQSIRTPSLCLPIKALGTVLGVLMLQEGEQKGSLDGLRPGALELTDQIGQALANMRLRDRLKKLSGHDPLPPQTRSGLEEAMPNYAKLSDAIESKRGIA